MSDCCDADLLKYRQDNFAVEVSPVRHPAASGEISLSITHNGRQWQSVTLLPEEVAIVIDALKPHKPIVRARRGGGKGEAE